MIRDHHRALAIEAVETEAKGTLGIWESVPMHRYPSFQVSDLRSAERR